jgi:hypothetical protein
VSKRNTGWQGHCIVMINSNSGSEGAVKTIPKDINTLVAAIVPTLQT